MFLWNFFGIDSKPHWNAHLHQAVPDPKRNTIDNEAHRSGEEMSESPWRLAKRRRGNGFVEIQEEAAIVSGSFGKRNYAAANDDQGSAQQDHGGGFLMECEPGN